MALDPVYPYSFSLHFDQLPKVVIFQDTLMGSPYYCGFVIYNGKISMLIAGKINGLPYVDSATIDGNTINGKVYLHDSACQYLVVY